MRRLGFSILPKTAPEDVFAEAASRILPTSCSYASFATSTKGASSSKSKGGGSKLTQPSAENEQQQQAGPKPRRLPGPFGRPMPRELSDAFGYEDRAMRRERRFPQIAADNSLNAPLRFQSGSQSVRAGAEGTVAAQAADVARFGGRITRPMADREGWVNGGTASSVLSLKPIVLSKAIDRAIDAAALTYLHEKVARTNPTSSPTRIAKHGQMLSILARCAALQESSGRRNLCGKDGPLEATFLSAMNYCKEHVSEFNVAGIYRFLEAWGRVDPRMDAAVWPRVQDRLAAEVGDIHSFPELQRLIWSVAAFKPGVSFRRDVRDALEARVAALAPAAKCSDASSCLAAFGAIYWSASPAAIGALSATVARKAGVANPNELAKSLLGLGKLLDKFPDVYTTDAPTVAAIKRLCAAAEPRLEELFAKASTRSKSDESEASKVDRPLKPIDVAQILAAFRLLGYQSQSPALLSSFAAMLQSGSGSTAKLSPMDAASMIGGLLAQTYAPSAEEAAAWGSMIGRRVLLFEEGSLASLASGIEDLETRQYPAYRALAHGAAQALAATNARLGAVSGDRAGRTLKVLAKIKLYPGAELTDTLLAAAAKDALEGQMPPDRAVDVLWSAATLRHRPSPAQASALLRLCGGLSLQQASDALWSLALLAVVPRPSALGPLLQQVEGRLAAETAGGARPHAKTLSRVMHAAAYLVAIEDDAAPLRAAVHQLLGAGGVDESIEPAGRATTTETTEMTDQGHTNAGAAALVVFLRRLGSLFTDSVAPEHEPLRGLPEGLPQVYQALWILEKGLGPAAAEKLLADSVTPELRAAALQAAKAANTGRTTSAFQRDVQRSLEGLGLCIQSEHLLADGLHSVDIVIQGVSEGAPRAAVSVEGPSHFSRNDLALLGFRGRVERVAVQAEGFRLARVPFFEWAALGNDPERKKEYMRRKVAEVTATAGEA